MFANSSASISPCATFWTTRVFRTWPSAYKLRRLPSPAARRLRGVSRDRPLPLSPAQQRQWSLVASGGYRSTDNLSWTLCFTGPLSVTALEVGLAEIVQRHESLRTTFRVQGGKPYQVVVPLVPLTSWWSDLDELDERRLAEVRPLVLAGGFDLGRGPLLQAVLLRLGAGRHVLVLRLHRIVADGWSARVLDYELLTSTGQPWPGAHPLAGARGAIC